MHLQLHSEMGKSGDSSVLKQPQHARDHRADGLHGGGEGPGGGGEHGTGHALQRKLNTHRARNNVAKNEPHKWNSKVERPGVGGGGSAGGGGAAENIGAVQYNWRAADALAGAVSGGCAAELAVDGEAVQEDASAPGRAPGGKEEESGEEEKGGGVGHLWSIS